jgi:hypothetical protein
VTGPIPIPDPSLESHALKPLVLAVLFTLPRLRTLRPAALRKLSSEGAWRNDADAAPANDGREENPVFDFNPVWAFVFVFALVFALVLGVCAKEVEVEVGCAWRVLPVCVYVERDDRREVVERAVRD